MTSKLSYQSLSRRQIFRFLSAGIFSLLTVGVVVGQDALNARSILRVQQKPSTPTLQETLQWLSAHMDHVTIGTGGVW